jgi:uncharacterized membrane protein
MVNESRIGMVTRLRVAETAGSDPRSEVWLPAADVPLDGGRTACVAFDRAGRTLLRVVLDRPASDLDVEVLERAADALPHLRLADLDAGSDYPLRHARHFGLEAALGPAAFNRAAEVELVAPGGRRLPRALGSCGLPARTVVPAAPRDQAAPGGGAAQAAPATATDDVAEAGQPAGEAAHGGHGPPRDQATEPPAAADGQATTGTPAADDQAAPAAPATTGTAPAEGDAVAPEQDGPATGGGAVERALAGAGRRLQAATGQPAVTLCNAALGLIMAVFVGAFLYQTWTLHQRFGTYGYDVGIYDQGTWLLSRFEEPFSTIRGLPLFGDHASYVLIAVAPLYRLWPDPRLLLALQVVFLALPAVAVYRVGTRRLGNPAAGLAVAVAYLAYPGMQWAIAWQFHPEAIAAGALAMAALAADRDRTASMAAWIALALACREDVGLVVAGFGVLLALNGKRDLGRRTALVGLGWFLVVNFLLIPMATGRPVAQFEAAYRVGGRGPVAVLLGLPWIVLHAATTALTNDGLWYLLLVFLPFAGLPLLAPRWLLPAAGPLLLNLASAHPEQHQIRFHYLATTAPFLALAAVAGLGVVAGRRRALVAPMAVLLVLLAFATDWRYGPAVWSKDRVLPAASAQDGARRAALAKVDPDAPVSAQFHLVTHLGHRKLAYEFPNPFRAVNWGRTGDGHAQAEIDAVRWVVVEPGLLGQEDRALLDRLRTNGEWRVAYDAGGVVVLERVAEPPP